MLAGSGRVAATTVYVAPTGSDAGTCTQARPCASFDRAYRVAQPGDTVELAGGTYPAQTVRVDASKVAASADVVFKPAAGATVTIAGDLTMFGSHAVFRGSKAPYDFKLHFLISEGTPGATTSNHVRFENLDGAAFLVGPNHHITISGGDWGPNTGPGTQEDKVGPDGAIPSQWPHDIVLDGLYVHDQNSNDLSVEHMGGLFLISGYGIVLRNSHFARDVVYDVQVQDFTSPDCCGMTYGPLHDVLVENNVFDFPVTSLPEGAQNDRQPELQLDPRHGACWSAWTIRRNTFHNGLAVGFDAPPCFQRVVVTGNLGQTPGPQCFGGAAGLTWSDNLWLGAPCGSGDRTSAPFGYALDGTDLAASPRTAAAVRRAFALASHGGAAAKVARTLKRERRAAPAGGWSTAAVRAVLADRVYRGDRYGAAGSTPALVSARVWSAAQRALR